MADPKWGGAKFGEVRFGEYTWTPQGMPGDHNTYFLKINGANVPFIPIKAQIRNFNDAGYFNFWRNVEWDDPDFQNGDSVELLHGSNVIFRGTMVVNDRNAVPGQEVPLYRALDNLQILKNIPFKKNGWLNMVYNAAPGEPEYGIYDRDKTCGEIILDILETMETELSGIIDTWVESEISVMDVVPARIELTGLSVFDAITEVMSWQLDYGFYYDPDDNTLHFQSIAKANLQVRNISPVGKESTKINKSVMQSITRILIQGREEEERVDTISFDEGTGSAIGTPTLAISWDTGLQEDWTPELSEDDPEKYDNGKLYRQFTLSHQNCLPSLILSGSPTIIEFDPNRGVAGNWNQIGGKINLKTGTLRLTSPSFKSGDAIPYIPKDVHCRYCYVKDTPIEIDTGFQGTAYTERGWENTLAIYDPEFKKQTIKVVCTKSASGKLYDATGSFSDDLIGKQVGGNTITAAENGVITVPGTYTAGEEYTINFRDDTTGGLEKVSQAILNVSSDEYYIGEIRINGLDPTNYPLGTKINVTGTEDPDFATMGAPLMAVTLDFENMSVILGLTNQKFFNGAYDYSEWKRRLTKLIKRNKALAFMDLSVASVGGGESGSMSGAPDDTTIPEHTHEDEETGGNILYPYKLILQSGIAGGGMWVGTSDNDTLKIINTAFGLAIRIPYTFTFDCMNADGSSGVNYKAASSQNLNAKWK